MAEKSLCLISDCCKPSYSKGYCRNHYYRFRTHGDALGGRTPPGEPMAWLKSRINHNEEACLMWPFSRFQNGYAAVVCDGITTHAANVMCQEAHGKAVSPQVFALHTCGNGSKGCVNPNHVRWGTQAENMQHSVEDGTRCRGERHHHSKLLEEDIQQIRSLRGILRQSEIAEKFGIDPETVGRIQRRKAWAWLD